MFKLVKGKDGTTSFLPIDSKIGGKISYIKNKEKQANYVYKEVEEGKVINTETMKHELEQEIDREDDNPYKRVILNKGTKQKIKLHRWKIGLFSAAMLGMFNMRKRPHTN